MDNCNSWNQTYVIRQCPSVLSGGSYHCFEQECSVNTNLKRAPHLSGPASPVIRQSASPPSRGPDSSPLTECLRPPTLPSALSPLPAKGPKDLIVLFSQTCFNCLTLQHLCFSGIVTKSFFPLGLFYLRILPDTLWSFRAQLQGPDPIPHTKSHRPSCTQCAHLQPYSNSFRVGTSASDGLYPVGGSKELLGLGQGKRWA